MELNKTITNLDVDLIISDFITSSPELVHKFTYKAYKDTSKLAVAAFTEILTRDLKNSVISFINNHHNMNGIRNYLIHCSGVIANNNTDQTSSNVFVCPGCRYLKKNTILQARGKQFFCPECASAKEETLDEKEIAFFAIFSSHEKKGNRCPDCSRFIPNVDNNQNIVSCPYFDCCFYGNKEKLKKMHHPKMQVSTSKIELQTLDGPVYKGYEGGDIKSNIASDDYEKDNLNATESNLFIKEDFEENLSVLLGVIDSQIKALHYSSNSSTFKQKLLMYEAFQSMISEFPKEMVSYLVHLNRNGGLQHKIFQKYSTLLEKALPFTFTKGNKLYQVTSMLDENLCVFNGISVFENEIDSNFEIENKTTELYVGGRKGAYCKPYYIGKLIDVIDMNSNISLIEKVKEYTFFKIIMNDDVKPGTKVLVKHLRIAPHYQMGGMVYLNRIRRKIVDKVYSTIHGKKRETKNSR